MPNIVDSLPVKTRLPLAAWALAGLVTLFSLVSSISHLASHHAGPGLEQATQQGTVPQQARV
jgi:hypothetical protein